MTTSPAVKCANCETYPRIDKDGDEWAHRCADGGWKYSNGVRAFKSQSHLAPVWTAANQQDEVVA